MEMLKCDICGGRLVMQANSMSKCDSCGMDYSLEWMRNKVQEMKIVGSVEITKGEAELERELAAVKQFTELGYFEKAIEKGRKLIDEFPHDYRCWWEVAYANIKIFADGRSHLPDLKDYATAMQIAEKLPNKIAANLKQEWNDVWLGVLPRIESGKDGMLRKIISTSRNLTDMEWNNRLKELKHSYPALVSVIDRGVANAKALKDAGIRIFLLNDYSNNSNFQWTYIINDRTFNLSFVYYDTVVGSFHGYNQCNVYGPFRQHAEAIGIVNQNAINNIHQAIITHEKTFLDKDICPQCNGNQLNWTKRKCKKCTWERKW